MVEFKVQETKGKDFTKGFVFDADNSGDESEQEDVHVGMASLIWRNLQNVNLVTTRTRKFANSTNVFARNEKSI